ncbi:Tetratricopeptide repeat protein [Paragonimus heterotremus]|uniref:Tetratricopeptide repeat protein n=1 Tax=Paragonimus heterotremus TaxID=100268 RepID=A0A8J4TIX0_9TREM|nr:Tetratricopeptide repeat protein [Paragonimus heterotremus]
MDSVLSMKNRANELFRTGHFREAITLYDQCLLVPDIDDRCLRCVLYNNKSQVYLKLEDYENAVGSATEALKINPAEPKALFRRAQAFEKLGKFQQALEDSRKLIHLEPGNTAAQNLARRIEMVVTTRVSEADSLPARIKMMFQIVETETANVEKTEQALKNLTALITENGPTAASLVWSNPNYSVLFDFCNSSDRKLSTAAHRLMAHTFDHHPERCMHILNHLTAQYFVDRMFSRQSDESLEACRFLNSLLEGLTQLKAYQKAKDASSRCSSNETAKVAPTVYPKFKLDPTVEKPVFEILQCLFRATNNGRLVASVRDYILEMLIRFVPSEKGIGWSTKFVQLDGLVDRLLEIAGAAGTSAISGWRSKRAREVGTARETQPSDSTPDQTCLHTSPNTRMIVACLLAKLWDDLTSDKARDAFTSLCSDFVLDLFSDPFLETKVDAASVIGTLFLGPHELGASILSRPGILEGLFLLTQCPNMLYQVIALDTIILATQKKQQCLTLVTKAVPMLQNLYKAKNDGIKIRALVALCKFGAAGGSDVTVKSLTEGSASSLMRACRRLLLGIEQREPDVDHIAPVHQALPDISENGELVLNEPSDAEEENAPPAVVDVQRASRKPLPKSQASLAQLKGSETIRWAIEGLAYLSLNAEVKQEIVEDKEVINTLFHVAELDLKECGFALASVLAHLTNSLPRNTIEPEMVELAKFTKQHIPEEHPLDGEQPVRKRRQLLMDAGLSVALYNLTMIMADGPVGSQGGLRELISRLYLCASEEVSTRGRLVQAGASKALMSLALKSNTDAGKSIAAQALARLTITTDPRVTFPGQRSLELVRPLLNLISPDCDALQNFEGLLALTNLASLDDRHRHRIMAERGVPLIDHHMFEEHPMLRRAAVECVANMAQFHAFVVACGGRLPLDDRDLGSKLPYLASSTERVKLLVLYCCEFDDLGLVRAAVGALATMSYDPGIISRITNCSSWFETLQTLAGHDVSSIQHRAAHLLRNMILHGERSFCEYICGSNMLEVIMSLSQLPDLSPDEPLAPNMITLNPGVAADQLRNMTQADRKRTRECALEALQQLQQYGLVERASLMSNGHK